MPNLARRRHAPSSSPLTTRACAAFLGLGCEWIRTAIVTGVLVDDSLIKLRAEAIPSGPRCAYRIHFDDFVTFLRAIGWQRLPTAADVVPLRMTRARLTPRAARHASA